MRFVGTDLVGTLVGTTPENGLKMRYFGSFFGKLIPAQKQEKCPGCLIFTHLGRFTKAEREEFKNSLVQCKSIVDSYFLTCCFRGMCDFVCSENECLPVQGAAHPVM